MLVLTRKVGQVIVIDGGIEISVRRIQGNRVRLAVTAPRHVRIYRVETPETPGQNPLGQPSLPCNADLATMGALDARGAARTKPASDEPAD